MNVAVVFASILLLSPTVCLLSEASCRGIGGSYTTACLSKLWVQAGCNMKGTGSPTNNPGNLRYWRSENLRKVKSDMANYKRFADAGYKTKHSGQKYAMLCFGTGTEASCHGPGGSYTTACMSKLWVQAGCNMKGTGSPMNSPGNLRYWRSKNLGHVKYDMANYKRFADAGYKQKFSGQKYTLLCFGTEVDCGIPDIPKNGEVTKAESSTTGQKVKFNCRKGFKLQGSTSAVCEATGIWVYDGEQIPSCKATS